MPGSYIVAGARTPIGKMSGALAGFSAAELGSIAIKAALERAGVAPEEVMIKGKTNERMGWVGRGEGLACIAVATLARIAKP